MRRTAMRQRETAVPYVDALRISVAGTKKYERCEIGEVHSL
jgi:hypothetical protein